MKSRIVMIAALSMAVGVGVAHAETQINGAGATVELSTTIASNCAQANGGGAQLEAAETDQAALDGYTSQGIWLYSGAIDPVISKTASGAQWLFYK